MSHTTNKIQTFELENGLISKIYGELSIRFNQHFEAANWMACKTGQWLLDPDLFDPDLEQKPLFLISKKSKSSLWLHGSESNTKIIHVNGGCPTDQS